MDESYAGPVIENRPDTWYGYDSAEEAKEAMPQASDEDQLAEQTDNSGEDDAPEVDQAPEVDLGEDPDGDNTEPTPIGDAAEAAVADNAAQASDG